MTNENGRDHRLRPGRRQGGRDAPARRATTGRIHRSRRGATSTLSSAPALQGVPAWPAPVHLVFVHPPASYDEQRIDLHVSTRVKSIEPTAMQLRLDDGSRVAFDRLLLATGASPRKLDIPGSDLAGVHYLRSLEDADAIRRAALGGAQGRRRRWRLDRGRGRGLAPSARASCGDDRRGVRPVGARARGRGGRCSGVFTPSAGSSLS